MDDAARQRLRKLKGLTHMLSPIPRNVATPEGFNKQVQTLIDVLEGLKAPVVGPEPEPEAPDTGLEVEEPPERERKGNKPNRQHEGGENRSDSE